MAVNTCEMWSNRIKIAFFQKLTKIAQRLGSSPPDPHNHAGGSAPRPPSVIRLSAVAYSSRLLSQTFLMISFRPLALPKFWLNANGLRLQIFHSTISLPHNKFLFREFLMTSVQWICGLAPPPPIKNYGYVYECGIEFFSRSLYLNVDGAEAMYEASPQGLRNRRQDDRIESRPTVLIYLGGGENSAMFNGCIKYPYLSQ